MSIKMWETVKKLMSKIEKFSIEKTKDVLDLDIESNDSKVNLKVDVDGNPEFNYSKRKPSTD